MRRRTKKEYELHHAMSRECVKNFCGEKHTWHTERVTGLCVVDQNVSQSNRHLRKIKDFIVYEQPIEYIILILSKDVHK